MHHKLLLFLTLIALVSCNERHSNKEKPVVKASSAHKTIPNLKIYIEEGGSMLGFVNDPNFSFSSDISKLFTNVNKKTIDLNLIQDKIRHLDCTDSLSFPTYLSNLKSHMSGIGGSPFEKMLRMVVNKSNGNTVTCLVSDFIQSSNGITNNIAIDNFASLLSDKIVKNKDFAVGILKMNSRFKGDFYYVSPQRKNILPNPEFIDSLKPYYIWFFGDNELIKELGLNNNIFSSLIGFEDFSIYNSKKYDYSTNIVNWSILQHTNSIGTFEPSRKDGKLITTRNISNAKSDRVSNEFQLCIAIDLSQIPISESLKMDTNSYLLKSNGFIFQSISKLSGFNYSYLGENKTVDTKDKQTLSKINATHLIFIKTNEKTIEIGRAHV